MRRPAESAVAIPCVDEFASYLAGRLGDGSTAQLDSAERQRRLPSTTVVVIRGEMRPWRRRRIAFHESTGALVVVGERDGRRTPAELSRTLGRVVGPPAFVGRTPADTDGRRAVLALVENPHTPLPVPAPAGFRVLAVITMYNERDIAGATVGYLRRQGVEVRVVDNWSTDGGAETLCDRFAGDPGFSLERFPESGPSKTYEERALLGRVEEIAAASSAHWVIHHDVDEVRQSPWTGVTLRDALHCVQQRGFNCIDHTVIDFRPVDDSFVEGSDPLAAFRYFEFGRRPGHFQQIKAWLNTCGRVDLASSGGHIAQFPGRRVFPYKFLLRHYPIRSQAQGERKIFRDRQARWSAEERAMGWHIQYDDVTPLTPMLFDPTQLWRFDERFDEDFLIERLSGVGVATGRR